MNIRSTSLSLTAAAVAALIGAGCAQSTSLPSGTQTSMAASMGNEGVNPNMQPAMDSGSRMALTESAPSSADTNARPSSACLLYTSPSPRD